MTIYNEHKFEDDTLYNILKCYFKCILLHIVSLLIREIMSVFSGAVVDGHDHCYCLMMQYQENVFSFDICCQ